MQTEYEILKFVSPYCIGVTPFEGWKQKKFTAKKRPINVDRSFFKELKTKVEPYKNTIIMTVVNHGQAQLAKNFIANVKAQNNTKQLVVFCLSKRTKEELKDLGVFLSVIPLHWYTSDLCFQFLEK